MAGFSALPTSTSSTTATWSGVARVKGPKWARMPLLTLGMLGLQIVWSVEMGYAPPYLLSLGLSKSLMSIVFVAGPLSGLIVQPLIGVLADHSRSKFGRRRPYMIIGSLICVGAYILLGFTRWFSDIFTSPGSRANDILTIAFAVWSIYCIDFSINAVQAADRALLVDVLPPSQQEVGNAWAGRMFGLGSVAGFFIGNIDLAKALPLFGKSQLQVLSVVTSIFLMLTQGLTSASVTEKVLVKESGAANRGGFMDIFRDIWSNVLALPRTILQVCFIQFFSWIAWFPVLFFSTVYVGEIYTREQIAINPALKADDPSLQTDATRAGSRALLWSSILSFSASILLPFVVTHVSDRGAATKDSSSAWNAKSKNQPSMGKVQEFLSGFKLHMATLWALSHFIFAITMFMTFLTTTVDGASALITITGFSWAVSQWVPFSLLGEAILSTSSSSKYDMVNDRPIPLTDHRTHQRSESSRGSERQVLMFDADQDVDDIEGRGSLESAVSPTKANGRVTGINIRLQPPDLRRSLSSASAQHRIGTAEEDGMLAKQEDDSDFEDIGHVAQDEDNGMSNKAGIILGIHNIFVVIPQFLVTGLSSILFAIMEPDKSVLDQGHAGHPAAGNVPPKNATVTAEAVAGLLRRGGEAEASSPDSVGLIFRIGGVSAAIACVLCWRLSRELQAKNR